MRVTTVLIEGEETVDGRFIIPGSTKIPHERVPFMDRTVDPPVLLGDARVWRDGDRIMAEVEVDAAVVGDLFFTQFEHRVEVGEGAYTPRISITGGELRAITATDTPAWPKERLDG